MIRHQFVGCVDEQVLLGSYAAGYCGFARTSPATDPIDVLELFLNRWRKSQSIRSQARARHTHDVLPTLLLPFSTALELVDTRREKRPPVAVSDDR